MRALTWQGTEKVAVTDVPDPVIEHPLDAVVRVTSTAICGSDLHLYRVLGPFLKKGDVLGHEFMGIVEEVGSGVERVKVGDRVVVPFNISCGTCWMCERGFYAQCETTQNRDQNRGASLFGYTSMYGSVPGGQAERVRVPYADFGPVVLPAEHEDDRFLYLSDILPTAWQGVKWAGVEPGQSLLVMGLGPVGQLAVRIAKNLGIEQVIGVDLVPERLAKAAAAGVTTIDAFETDDVPAAVRDLTDGRGADAAVEAVGMEAHGSPAAETAISGVGLLPKAVGRALSRNASTDQLAALETCFEAVRRSGTVSISGVYGGAADALPLGDIFDKQLTLRMGQCNVRAWTTELTELLLQDDDVLGVDSLATHHVPLEQAAEMYEVFQKKQDGCIKVVLKP